MPAPSPWWRARFEDHAHRNGVLLRRETSDNLLFSADGILKVTDFGIAKVVVDGSIPSGSTGLGTLKGTPAYMAPEQVLGTKLGPGVDIYATGLLLYELLSGRLPFGEEGSPLVVAFRRSTRAPTSGPDQRRGVPGAGRGRHASPEPRAADPFRHRRGLRCRHRPGRQRLAGAGWLDHARVALLSPGPIMDSAHAVRTPSEPLYRPDPPVVDPSAAPPCSRPGRHPDPIRAVGRAPRRRSCFDSPAATPPPSPLQWSPRPTPTQPTPTPASAQRPPNPGRTFGHLKVDGLAKHVAHRRSAPSPSPSPSLLWS